MIDIIMQKRAWSIFIAILLIGGLLPTVGEFPPGGWFHRHNQPEEESLAESIQIPPTLASSQTSTPAPAYTPTVTRTPLQPVLFTATATQAPTLTPTSSPTPEPTLPSAAEIDGIYGYWQLLPLSCESRSAADWARHFGIEIHELEFFNRLPKSSNPEEGFVGNVYGGWGNIPPGPYGVHAQPIAALLREYGAKASALKGMSFEALKYEIASGRPVMVWITGSVAPGKGVPYTVGESTITVAPYEHTVLAVGYDEGKDLMYFLDGKQIYSRSYEVFQASWGALENLAVVWDE